MALRCSCWRCWPFGLSAVRLPSGQWELYDLENDRTESNDLARVHPEKVEELSALHRAWEKRIGVRDWQSLLNMGGLDEIPER